MAQVMAEGLTGQDAMGVVVVVEQMTPVLHYRWQNDQIVLPLNATALVQGLPQLDETNAKTEDNHSCDFHHYYCYQTFCLIFLNFEMMKEIAAAKVEEVRSFLQKLMQNLKKHCL